MEEDLYFIFLQDELGICVENIFESKNSFYEKLVGSEELQQVDQLEDQLALTFKNSIDVDEYTTEFYSLYSAREIIFSIFSNIQSLSYEEITPDDPNFYFVFQNSIGYELLSSMDLYQQVKIKYFLLFFRTLEIKLKAKRIFSLIC